MKIIQTLKEELRRQRLIKMLKADAKRHSEIIRTAAIAGNDLSAPIWDGFWKSYENTNKHLARLQKKE